jgi:hypothetical protein
MSWNNALPWWVYETKYERFEAMCCCAFPEELAAGWTRSVPKHVISWIRNARL